MRCKPNKNEVIEYKLHKKEENLKEKGRLQFFHHCPDSRFPIRDVVEKKKVEPHIEIGAENYWYGCYQSNNIEPFISSDEKYLFLMTTCKNKRLKKFYEEKFIVGYIRREITGEMNGRKFIKGDPHLYSFEDSIRISEIGCNKYTRLKLLNKKQTRKTMKHFNDCKNIIEGCVKEIARLDEENETCLRITEGRKCIFHDDCLRSNIL